MFKNRKQFCRFAIKFNSLPLTIRQDLEKEFIIKAKQYCRREELGSDEVVITMIKADQIPFSFIATSK